MTIQSCDSLKEFNLLSKEISDIYVELNRSLGISGSVFDILYTISNLGDGCLQKDICAMSFTSKQTINSAIRKMEQENLLYLTPGKGREMHIHLTPAGKKVMEEKIFPVIQIENQIFEEMSESERKEYIRLTRKYLQRMRELTKGEFIV